MYHLSKGNQVNIFELRFQGYFCGNANELRDISKSPRKSSLFFLTVFSNQEKNKESNREFLPQEEENKKGEKQGQKKKKREG